MKQTPASRELIGRKVVVIQSPNRDLQGLTGTIVDETKGMLHIATDGMVKKVSKAKQVFQVHFDNEVVDIGGDDLVARPWDRLFTKRKTK